MGINAWEVGDCPSTGGNVWLHRAMNGEQEEPASYGVLVGLMLEKVEEGRISALGFSILTPPIESVLDDEEF